MIRALAMVNLAIALLILLCVVFGLAVEFAPKQTAQLIALFAKNHCDAGDDYVIIGGDADSPTAVFVSTHTEGAAVPMLLLSALLSLNAIVLWRRRDTRPVVQSEPPGQGATVSS